MVYTLPESVMREQIRYDSYNNHLIIPSTSKLKEGDVRNIAEVIAAIIKDKISVSPSVEELPSNYEFEKRYRIGTRHSESILHVPHFTANSLRKAPDNIQGAQDAIVVLGREDSCGYCLKGLEEIADALNPAVLLPHSNKDKKVDLAIERSFIILP